MEPHGGGGSIILQATLEEKRRYIQENSWKKTPETGVEDNFQQDNCPRTSNQRSDGVGNCHLHGLVKVQT